MFKQACIKALAGSQFFFKLEREHGIKRTYC